MIGKIVWDWLSKRSENTQTHKDCTRIITLEEAFHAAHLRLAEDVSAIKAELRSQSNLVQDVADIKADIRIIKKTLNLNGNGKS